MKIIHFIRIDYQNDSAPNVDSLLRIGRTGSLFVENETSTVSAFISSDPREWGFSNHFGQIIQLTGKPTCISLKLDSGIMWYFIHSFLKFYTDSYSKVNDLPINLQLCENNRKRH